MRPNYSILPSGAPRLLDASRQFFNADVSSARLAIFRMLVGLALTCWALAGMADAGLWFPEIVSGGPTDGTPVQPGRSAWVAVGLHISVLFGGLCLVFGRVPRTGAAVSSAALGILIHADGGVLNSGESLLRVWCFVLVLAPSDLPLRWGTPGRRSCRALPMRIAQLQMSVVYGGTFLAKVRGPVWRDGTATGITLQLAQFRRGSLPLSAEDLEFAASVLTYSTLVIEAALAVLVWWAVVRPAVLVAGVTLHVGIEYSMIVGFFSLVVMLPYVLFLRDETASRMVRFLESLVVKAQRLLLGQRFAVGEVAGAAENSATKPVLSA